MPVVEMFFDYSCPYCLRGHNDLVTVIADYPQIQMKWMPCEAHPRPEPGPHIDLALQGMLFARDNGADLWAFHERMYDAVIRRRIDREDIAQLADAVRDLVDAEAFAKALREGKYAKEQQGINDYAYEESGVWAVPSFRMEGKKLDALEGVGVTQAQIRALFDQA